MPPIFKHQLAPEYVNAFLPTKEYLNGTFLSEHGKRMLGLDEDYAREISGTWTNGLRTDYPYRAALDGVLKELLKLKRK